MEKKINENALVSVIIPTYCGSKTLGKTIESVINQTYPYLEIIVVDDNDPSSNERYMTEDLLCKYLIDKRVIYIKHDRNKNGSAARNSGYKKSKGDYIMFLDDDDEFEKTKVEVQLKNLSGLSKDWGCNYTKYIKKLNGKFYEECGENRYGQPLTDQLARNFFVQGGSNLMLRKEVIEDIGFFDESFERNQDVEFLTRILQKYKIAYVDEYGLCVNLKKIRSNVDYIELTNQYIETFKAQIEKSNQKDKIYLK